jgi:hypothetical protein
VAKRILFTLFVYGVALFLQGLFVGTSPHMLDCNDFPKQLLTTALTLVPEYLFLAIGLFFTLKLVFDSSTRAASACIGAFTLGCLISALWLMLDYYKDNGC